MPELDSHKAYNEFVRKLKSEHPPAEAMALAVGDVDEFERIGLNEANILLQHGLKEGDYLIDVGCGSGRLAWALARKQPINNLRYLGTDVVPELVDYARSMAGRADWKFAAVNEIRIPESDGQADFVCFFSVFTHLLHEHSYLYLEEAKRVLKPGGKILFSFLEYDIHWKIFHDSMQTVDSNRPLITFIGRDAIMEWAKHLALEITFITPRRDSTNPVAGPEKPSVGQSACVLTNLRA